VVGALALVAALVATSVVVWTSPTTSPVTGITRVAEAIADQQRILDERNLLLDQVVDLKDRLAATQDRLDDRAAQLDHAEQELAEATAQLASAQERIANLEQELAVSQARAASSATPSRGTETRPSGGAAPAPAITAPSKAQLVAPTNPYYGMYTEQSPFNWAGLDATSAKVGALPNVAGYFGGWDEPFRSDAVTRSWQRGMLPLLTWESRPIDDGNDVVDAPDYALSRIIGGSFDDYLRQYARDVVATGLPLAIRLDHEMNGTWYPWSESANGNSRGEFVQMWRHVHDVFEQEGANAYVIWVWAPNRIDSLGNPDRMTLDYLRALYPGDDYVDWTGMSGYLRPPVVAGDDVGFDATFGRTLEQLRAISGKRILLAEVGATEDGGRKAQWVRSFFDGLEAPANRDIVGFVWFSMAVTSYTQGEITTNDWRIDSRQDSLDAFRDGLLGEGTRFSLTPTGS